MLLSLIGRNSGGGGPFRLAVFTVREVTAVEDQGEVLSLLRGLPGPGNSHRHGAPQEKQEPGGAKPRVRHSEPRGYRVLPGDVPPAGAHV